MYAIVLPKNIISRFQLNLALRYRIFCARFYVIKMFLSLPTPTDLGHVRRELSGDRRVAVGKDRLVVIGRLGSILCGLPVHFMEIVVVEDSFHLGVIDVLILRIRTSVLTN